MGRRSRRRIACIKRNFHDSLVDIVKKHSKLYDSGRGLFEYSFYDSYRRKNRNGEIDWESWREKSVTVYEVKSNHTPKAYQKAIRQLNRRKRYLNKFHPDMKVNLVYVTKQGVARIRDNPKSYSRALNYF